MLTTDGQVYAWGSGMNFSLGDGTESTASASTPQLVLTSQAAPADTYLSPTSQVRHDGFVDREYAVDYLPMGASLQVLVKGTVNKAAADFRVLNQAWFTSDDTPKATPDLPADPGPNPDQDGIGGNPTCNTDVGDQPKFTVDGDPAFADSCDQVPVEIKATTDPLGWLSGMVWVDANADGTMEASETVRLAGVPVQLYRNGTLMGETVTAADGSYRFDNLPIGDGYQVQFDAKGGPVPPAGSGLYYGFTLQDASGPLAAKSFPDRASGQTPVVSVPEAGTPNVNAGVMATRAALTVVKTSSAGEPASLTVPTGDQVSATTPVTVTVTNTGEEPLSDFTWTDDTTAGPKVTWTGCTLDGVAQDWADDCQPPSALVLAPGKTLVFTGTLPGLADGQTHTDEFGVTGVGTVTGVPATGTDPWQASAVAEPDPGFTVYKTGVPGGWVRPGERIDYTVVGQNTGNTDLNPVSVTDDLTEVLGSASIPESGVFAPQASVVGPGAEANTSGTLTFDPAAAAPQVRWTGTLAAGQSVVISYSATVKDDAQVPGRFANTAAGEATPPGCAASDCVITPPPSKTEHTLYDAGYELAKTASPASGSSVPRGGIVTYTVTGTNTGPTPLDPVTVTDDLAKVLNHAVLVTVATDGVAAPAATVLGPDQGDSAAATTGQLSWDLAAGSETLTWTGTLAVGQRVEIVYSVRVADAVASGTVVNNTVTSQAQPVPPDAPGNPDTPPPAITPPPVSTDHTVLNSVFVQKLGQDSSGAEVAMDGSAWQLLLDDNGTPGDPVGVTGQAVDDAGSPVTGLWRFDALPAGTYWLVETDAPEGFALLVEPAQFSIDDTGAVTVLEGAGSRTVTAVAGTPGEATGGFSVIEVRDVPALVLPAAGGPGLAPFWILAVALFAAAAEAARVQRRRAREGGAR